MNVLVTGRGWGKTSYMLKWFMENPSNRVIVTVSYMMASDVRRKLIKLYPQVAGDDEILKRICTIEHLRGMDRRTEVGIDNADLILSSILNREIDLITVTGNLVEQPE